MFSVLGNFLYAAGVFGFQACGPLVLFALAAFFTHYYGVKIDAYSSAQAYGIVTALVAAAVGLVGATVFAKKDYAPSFRFAMLGAVGVTVAGALAFLSLAKHNPSFVLVSVMVTLGWAVFVAIKSLLDIAHSAQELLVAKAPALSQSTHSNADAVRGNPPAIREIQGAAPTAQPAPDGPAQVRRAALKLSDIAGMADTKRDLTEFLKAVSSHAPGVAPDRNGLLLSGPPGNGKTMMAEAVAGELGLPFIKVTVDQVSSRWVGASQENAAAIVEQAIRTAPCILFFDEFDAIAPSRDGGDTHAESKKTVGALLTSLDEARRKGVVVVAATNYPDQLDPAVVREGRFDFKIEIPYPDLEARVAIIAGLAAKHAIEIDEQGRMEIARLWVERSASFMDSAFKRVRDDKAPSKRATVALLKAAGHKASRRESAIPTDCADVDALFLPAEVRDEVNSLMHRMANWEKVQALGGSVPKGVLLFGPPGTGKTSLSKAIAKSLGGWHVFEAKTAELLADPRRFKELMALARQHRPAIVLLDEADELLRDRNYSANATATNEILKAMDGMMANVPEVVFFAATNNREAIDAAALRGGRFSDRLEMANLSGDDLVAYVEKVLASKAAIAGADGVSAKRIADLIGDAGPADVNEMVAKAINRTFGREAPLNMHDFEQAVGMMRR